MALFGGLSSLWWVELGVGEVSSINRSAHHYPFMLVIVEIRNIQARNKYFSSDEISLEVINDAALI